MDDHQHPLALELINLVGALRSSRAEDEALWNQIISLVIPRRYKSIEKTGDGHKEERRVLDSTAQASAEVFASFLFTALCNPTVNWLPLGVSGPGASPDKVGQEVSVWLDDVSSIIRTALEGPGANVYSAMHEAFIDLATLGTAIIYIEQDPNPPHGLRVIHCNLMDTFIDIGESGRVDRVFRRCEWSPRQIRQRWPDHADLGKSVTSPQAEQPSRENRVIVTHAVFPSTDQRLVALLPDPKLADMGEFVSVWINETDRKLIDVGHYEEFPYAVPRWYTTGSTIYGRSPAMSVLGDIMLVNEMTHSILKGVQRLVDPPWLVPYRSIMGAFRTFPGGITYSDGNIEPKPLVPPGGSRIEYGDKFLADRQEAIRRGFFVPLILSQQSPVRTATEVLAVQDERNRATGPMVHRLKGELFDALVTRAAGILWRAGYIPEPPAGFDPRRARLAYRDPISASVQVQQGLATMRLLESLGPWSQALGATVFDGINPDRLASVLLEASGAPAVISNTPAEARKVKAAAAKASEQQGMVQQAAAVSPALQAVAALKKAGVSGG